MDEFEEIDFNPETDSYEEDLSSSDVKKDNLIISKILSDANNNNYHTTLVWEKYDKDDNFICEISRLYFGYLSKYNINSAVEEFNNKSYFNTIKDTNHLNSIKDDESEYLINKVYSFAEFRNYYVIIYIQFKYGEEKKNNNY